MARVRISKTPKALSGLEVKMRPGLYGTNGNRQFTLPNQVNSQRFSQQPVDVRNTLQPVAREGANLEAEKGETALVNIDGVPAHFKIGGKRHSKGGTPLNLPDNSFIFSDTAKMKIKDPIILAQFGMVPKKAGYTPAEIAKKYDINTFRKILADPNSEDIERKTAEAMIANYNMKLAKLALVQESTKGFPQGIPAVAMPYVIANDIKPEELFETQGQQEQPDADMGVSRYGGNMISQFNTKKHGGLHMAQTGVGVTPGFGKGLNTQPEGEFAKKYPSIYNAYMQALNSGEPEEMTKVANLIESQQTKQTPWYSLDMIPGSDADMFENLSTILKQKSKKTKNNYSAENIKSEYKDLPVKLLGIYGKLKEQYKAIPDSDYMAKIDVDNNIKVIEGLLPANKARYLPSPVFSSEKNVKEPWQIYSKEDLNKINNVYNDLFKSVPKEKTKEEEIKTDTDQSKIVKTEIDTKKNKKDVEVKSKPKVATVKGYGDKTLDEYETR